MPVFSLPIVEGQAPRVEGEAEQLVGFLAPANDPRMVARLGDEKVVRHEGALMVLEGDRFRIRDGWVQGRRYLMLGNTGAAIAALNLTRRKEGSKIQAVVSNVFVDPAHRRQGLASRLLQTALADYPKLMADSNMTESGAALMGVGQPPRSRAPRP